ncbi:MAG: ATP-binding protein [Planctomycetota bacterium]
MRSLRRELLLGTALATAAVLLVCGVVLYALIRRTLWADFDAALVAKARSLAALLEQNEDGLESELAAAALPEFRAAQRTAGHVEYYQVWLPDGAVFARSPSLAGGDLKRPAGVGGPFAADDAPIFGTAPLPNGRTGRVVTIASVPRQEFPPGTATPALIVTLAVARDIGELAATLRRVRGLLLGVGVAAVALSAGVLGWVVRRNLRPIDRLGGQIAGVGERELHRRIEAAGVPAELVPVVQRLNDLLSRLEAAFERERRFTGDVAHELRTPLAGLRAKLELALARERAPEAYRVAMHDSLAVTLQAQRLVENLLHLARADAGQLELHCEPVDVAALTRECWQSFAERAAARGLRMEWRANDACGPVVSDADALRLILRNILDNAVTYASEQGRVSLSIAAEDGATVVAVRNTSGLAPSAAARVFERFWRADPSRERTDEVRCGLGLPLCKALVERLGGSISADVADGMFEISVRLPLRM